MSQNRQVTAKRMLKRKRGATIEALSKALRGDNRQARSVIDSLRRAGHEIENTGLGRFHLA